MTRRKADDAARSLDGVALEQFVTPLGFKGRVRENRGEIVVKDVGSRVVGRLDAARSLIARAEITFRVMRGADLVGGLLLLALPRTLGALGRDEDPVSIEGVMTPVRVFQRRGNHKSCVYLAADAPTADWLKKLGESSGALALLDGADRQFNRRNTQ